MWVVGIEDEAGYVSGIGCRRWKCRGGGER